MISCRLISDLSYVRCPDWGNFPPSFPFQFGVQSFRAFLVTTFRVVILGLTFMVIQFSLAFRAIVSFWAFGAIARFPFGVQSRVFISTSIAHFPIWRSRSRFHFDIQCYHSPFAVQSHFFHLAFRSAFSFRHPLLVFHLVFRATVHFPFGVQSRCFSPTSRVIVSVSAFRAISIFSLGVQSHQHFQSWHSEPSSSHFWFRRSEPSSLFSFGVQSHHHISSFGVQSHHRRSSVSAFRAIITL